MPVTCPALAVLPREEWTALEAAHTARADELTAGRRERTSRRETHPVEDFLFEYYPFKPSQLRRWHPGVGLGLQDADAHAGQRWYSTSDGVTSLDVAAYVAERGEGARHIRRLLAATAGRTAQLGCFGMHEWAMVYGANDAGRRHGLSLRLGTEGT